MPSDEEYQRFRKAVIKKLKFLEGLIDDQWQKINDSEANMVEKTDEAINRAARAERAVRRLKKELEADD